MENLEFEQRFDGKGNRYIDRHRQAHVTGTARPSDGRVLGTLKKCSGG
jgi:hypothetical protein